MTEQIAKKPLVILAGATAVGKTELSVTLAQKIGGEIISADSMQVYKGMDIGTAKITKEEMNDVPHYLIDVLDPREDFNVCTFKSLAKQALKEIYAHHNIPVLVGGTGFYIQSVLYDIEFSDETGDKSYRHFLEQRAETEGPEALYALLRSIDPQAAGEIHPHNIKRVIRALEYHHETGSLISAHNAEQRSKASPYNYLYLILDRPRAEIYDRIEQRVDRMLKDGLIEEVQTLLANGVPADAVSMQGLGYKEIVSYLNGTCGLMDAVSLLKKNTRHFAKRQITWFKREPEAVWLNYQDHTDLYAMLTEILKLLEERNIYSGTLF